MTPQEFKAWFDGFTEAFDRVPSKAQWERVKARVAEIDGKPVTERIYVDRYWPTYPQYRPNWVYSTNRNFNAVGMNASCTNSLNANVGQAAAVNQYAGALQQGLQQGQSYNSINAMTQLGRMDAKALAS